eukprot:TRINITY_DN1833_c0_g1_i2.p3 TRINITY_DN1833_c0_g1~~TRINITY_DN1833_c0_g1_i2.p3  ORF type:complete len:110 (-),score=22.42 TRINITY_DN1833_c0_g1_i2:344-628(-)
MPPEQQEQRTKAPSVAVPPLVAQLRQAATSGAPMFVRREPEIVYDSLLPIESEGLCVYLLNIEKEKILPRNAQQQRGSGRGAARHLHTALGRAD